MRFEKAASPSTPTPTVSNSTLVYHLDLFIIAFIIAFFLFNIPRALVYLANHRSQVFQGYLLHSAKRLRMYRSTSKTMLQSEKEEPKKEKPEFVVPTLESPEARQKPWHFPMHLSLRHPAASFMHYRVLENYSIIQAILMSGYTGAVFYAAFYKSNPFAHPSRIGWIIASQFPFVYAFAGKSNVIGFLVGVGYEKLNYLHRHVGRLMVIGANVHAIGYIYKWTLAGNISSKLALPYACLHRPACIPYVIAASIIYGLDHIIRAIKTSFTTATIRSVPELGLTRVDIPTLNSGWRAGQHVRVRILSTAMGFLGMTEVHPFTIASATDTEEGLVLMCKKAGKWTNKLYGMSQMPELDEQGQQMDRRVRVMVEGPYGGIGDVTIPNYSGAMFVVGGSGVTFALSAVQDLVLVGDRSRIQIIEIIWSVPGPAALEGFISLFNTLVSQNIAATNSRLGITLTPGRPKMDKLLDIFVSSMRSKQGTHGAFVGVCGPVALAKDVAHSVRTFDANSKKAIGGIQFHEE
ncbi:hypothetical protein JVU11DRAFT_8487 [Chiua virens]|nr:hypothetical protein JVU11DRAFT_8487 [Chiua virens]